MSDIEFSLPLPVNLNPSELNAIRSKAWGAVSTLSRMEIREWPTKDKVRIEFDIYTASPLFNKQKVLSDITESIGSVLWSSKSPLVLSKELIVDNDNRIVVRVFRRKLISTGAGNHYSW